MYTHINKGLPSKYCVLPVEVGAWPERDEAERKKNKEQNQQKISVKHSKDLRFSKGESALET